MAGAGAAHADIYAARLADSSIDAKAKLQSASELRDSIDMFTHAQPAEYTRFLQKLMPVFLEILRESPVFISTSPEQKLRGMILDTIHRLPFTPLESLEPWAEEVMKLLMDLVRHENEENAVLCMKTIMDFQRNYQRQLASLVQPFLDLIMDMFRQMPKAVKDTFDNASLTAGGTPAMPGTPGNSQNFQSPKPMSPMIVGGDPVGDTQQPAKLLTRGMQSFKVLAECPIIVVSLFQAHRNSVHKNVKLFVPLIKDMLQLQAGPQREAHEQALTRGENFTGVSANIKNRVAFGEFVTAQVKTMSFLAYVLRVYAQQLTDFLPLLPEIVVRLLKDCPRERSGARKELLVATRHIINFNFRRIFLKKIDELLDERVLIGDGLTVFETMRPLAYSMLADLIHHVRESLNPDQIRRTVDVYTKNLHDNFPGTSFQTMSAKLLLNLAEYIAKLEDKQEARHFLIMILDAIAEKFAAMNRQYPNAVKQSRIHKKYREEGKTDEEPSEESKDDYDEIDIFTATPIKTSNPRERGSDPVADNKFLFKNLMNGLKNMLFSLRSCNPPSPPGENMPANWNEVAFGFSAEEVNIIIKLFREGARVFRYYRDIDKDENSDTTVTFMAPNGKEEKELLETFATVFHCIDPATFHEVFHSEIPYLYEIMFDHSALLHVPQFFLASEATSPSFCGMLLQFLMDNIEDVGASDENKSQVLLRLFKLSFMAVTLFSAQNEIVLLPHVRDIVLKSIHLATTAERPMNYFFLLRSLFRSIGGGRFEHLYKEILPLLEVLLENLNTQLNSARKTHERDLYVELCLTVPARLSNLLPHLSYLMKPLVVALRAGQELVSKGLKTLELCVDNLTADYLDPIMAPYIDDLMAALWEHLKPLPYHHFHSHTTMRILGKLGGRNRRFLTHPPELEYKTYSDDISSMNVKLIGAPGERPFPVLTMVDLALERILEIKPPKTPEKERMTDLYYKQQSLRYLSSTLKIFIGFDQLPEDFMQMVRLHANDLYEGITEPGETVIAPSDRKKSVFKKHEQEAVLRKLIRAVMHATAIEQLADEASALAYDVCRHFTVLELGRAVIEARQRKQQFSVTGGEGPMHLDSRVLAGAIGDCLASDPKKVRDTAKKAMKVMYDAAAVLFGSDKKVDRLPFFTHLAKTFCHNCYEEEWYPKFGGVLGIRSLVEDLDMGDEWLKERQNDLVRGLIYVIKDMPQELPAVTRNSAQEVLTLVLKRCNQGVPKEEFTKYHSRNFNLCALLVCEISNPNKHVREAAQTAFTTLEEIVGVPKHTLMVPVKERLLTPIFNKPLRALPFASQIGYIDAITYCLRLEPSFLEFNEEMNRLMMEALALADADDEQLSNGRLMEYRTTESVLNLRVVCIKLLSTAILAPEFNTPDKAASRGRIISVFFKSLYYKSPEVIEAANAGLKGVLQQTNKLPRDLLQSGLRPILMNLSDPKRLNVAGLEGLARLLELLTNYFKVEIGSRLLEHLKTLADVNFLQQTSHKLLEQNQNIKVIAAILNIFHLLPPLAVNFMDGLFAIVLDLEEKLRRTQYSPVRAPLLKFINRYPTETWKHIQQRLVETKYGRLFAQLLRDESSKPLRDIVQEDVGGLLIHSLDLVGRTDPEKYIAIVNAINIVHSISCFKPKAWMEKNKELMGRLLAAAVELREKSKEGVIPVPIKLAVEQALALVMEVFMEYLSQVETDLDFLFEVIDATTSDKRARITNILTHHIYEKIICGGSVDLWRNILNKCLNLYSNNSSQETKTFAFHFLVNPILLMDKKRGTSLTNGTQKLVDKALVDNVHNKIWRPNLGDLGDDSAHGLDHSRMELLQMSALLIRDHHNSLAEARKDVIKFGWNYIKLEDIVNKQAAYVLIAFFIKFFETPSKIVIQIYVALLKAHQNEGRPLVTQALELISPVLRKRVPSRPDDKYPIWARWPRRILSEEGHNQHQMTNIFQFLVRHDDLFYDSREHFATWIVTAMPKLVFHIPNPSTEYKKLFIKLVTLIWKWENRRVELARGTASPESSPSRKRRHNGAMVIDSHPSPPTQNTDALAPSLRLLVIKHLVNFVCRIPEKFSGKPDEPCTKALVLLKDFLGPDYWSDLDIDLFPKTMEEYLITNDITDATLPGYVNALRVLKVILELKSNEWVMQQLAQLQKYLEKPLRSDNAEVQDGLQPVLSRILQAVPVEKVEGEEEDEEPRESLEDQFVSSLTNIVQESLNTNLMSSVHILHTLSEKRPGVIDDHIAALMKAFQKLGKDHLSVPAAGQPMSILPNGAKAEPSASGNGQQFDPETTTKLLCMVIDVAASRVSVLGDQRRPFLSVMAQLVEKSSSTKLCMKILAIVEKWVFGSTETFPTLKEKTAVLSKMLSFESRPDPELCNHFLELVIKIYEDPVITKTELTVRLEHAFLVGTRAKDVNMRNRFLQIFDRSISRTVSNRFGFIIGTQNWEQLNESYWLHQASHLLFGSVDMDSRIELHEEDLRVTPASATYATYGSNDKRKADVMIDDQFEDFMYKHRRFVQSLADVRSADILEPVRQLQHLDPKAGHEIWRYLFPLCWSALGREDRQDLSRGMVSLLARDWHHRCMDKRPNVIQSLLEGVERAKPRLNLPAHLVKLLSRGYDAWYTALRLLEGNVNDPPVESNVVRESNLDALTEMYAMIGEEDLFYGLWRRRAQYIETNAAISFEQHGMWDKAQQMYENAQIKARTGMLPFSNSEYMLWEDHWVICAQKLQQWEILSEFAKHENYNDLMLECGWRLIDNWSGPEGERMDQTVKSLMDSPTPRRFFFAAFMALQKVHQKTESPPEFSRLCDEAIQLSLRKWHSLPSKITNAHIPLLQAFQQLVELHDASVIYASLNATTVQNLDAKSQELKMLLGTWRDRLPNVWDDINSWHDLVTWRQHIFHSINQTYLPLLPGQNQSASGNSNSYGYRGYHETAWIINRFAHVARKHQLPDVCISQLSKIYTLPNIEIQEAFLKLREQAKCHYQNPSELTQGLEVINNTNLGYFASQQKAEFYTLKGMFLSKLKQNDEANEAFSLALYHDLKLPKAWAQWGHYNDQVFKENPSNMGAAGNAVSCYLEAAGLFKNGKARKLLGRVLWLLSLDDASASISASFDAYKGDVPVWYWITYIPQLLTSLSHKEARLARAILIKIAKNYPQALYFLLRTSREDFQVIKKQTAHAASNRGAAAGTAGSPVAGQVLPPNRQGSAQPPVNGVMDPGKAGSPQQNANAGQQGVAGSPSVANAQPNSSPAPGNPQIPIKRLPWEHAEEIMSVLKTAFPLLALSMETMGDQISKFFKCPPDEDAYRLIVALLNDGLQWMSRMNPSLEDTKLPPSTEANITRFAETILPSHIRVAFEADFVSVKPNLVTYIDRLRRWRDRFEEKLDRRPPYQNLETYSPHLSEFRFQKFDDVEVPGQYLLHKDNNKDFVRIDRFLPKVDVIRGYGICHRRLKMRGHDGSVHAFAVQHPAARHCRREERIAQLFRIFNGVLGRRKESRRRNLSFHLPLMIPLAPHLRLVQDDASYISLQAIFEDHCRQIGINKDDPIMFALKRVISSLEPGRTGQQVDPNVKMEIFQSIQKKMAPSTVVLEFLSKSYPSFSEFFLFRRQFSYQFAALTFITYVMTMSNRFPHKMFISRATGNIWGSELIPTMASTNPSFHNNEAVPFRNTPNIQTLMGPIAMEGIYSCAIMVIARCLSEPDVSSPAPSSAKDPVLKHPQFDLEQHLSVFVRDEMIFWFTQQHRSGLGEAQLREKVQMNSDMIIKKTMTLAQPGQGNLPANQTVIDLISKAANPMNLAQLDHLWMPYL
ncbi:hypothetical protein EDC01DRAFT_259729 [Geopyxis carbonaria]|nr:hypothetical protein EDC01DRAFT_259729 [Geopyxis carbonaria]